jgi:hypothetical protein
MDETFSCPYCGQDNSLFVDPSAGRRQKQIVDCEVCCRPIVIDLWLEGEEIVSLNVTKENE